MRFLLVALGVASAVGTAAAGHADPTVDASFVAALTKAGIGFNNPDNAVEAARSACSLMDQGKSQLEVVHLVMQENSAINTVNAAKFTAIAASAYCPQYLQQLKVGGEHDGVGAASGGAQ